LKTILGKSEGSHHVKVLLDGKASHLQVKSVEIVVPNLKQEPYGSLQFSGFPAGRVYVLKNVELGEKDAVKSI
jgi:hypothetical protein